MKSVKIVCIGAAVQDVFLQGKIFKAQKEDNEYVQEFELGTKNEVEDVFISTGGGATNAAVTFARQGLHSCFMGRIADDIPGKSVLSALHEEDIDTSLVMDSQDLGTGYSTILLAPNGERTVLTYRGASKKYDLKESDFHGIEADWFYISSLTGDVAALKVALAYAKSHNIKVAINPGERELDHIKQFRELLDDITLLSLNKEEMAELFTGKNPHQTLQNASKHVPMALLTDGAKGSYATDGVHFFSAGMYDDVKVVDRLGAGDAFSSGFVSEIARGHSMEQALTFASANSTSVVSQIGAKTGILHAGTKLHPMPIEVTNL